MFRWPTDYDFNGGLMDALFQPHNYDDSEDYAWQSATGLTNLLTRLIGEYPGHVFMLAHSMGNVVAGEALRLAGSNQIVNTYVASQAAIPAHVYDSTVTNLIEFTYTSSKIPNYLNWQALASYGPQTPNIYGNRLAGNSAAVGRRINFYNVNDFALSPDAWCFNQELKPDVFVGSGYYYYNGGTTDPAPWNNFQYIVYSPDGPNRDLDIVNSQQDLYDAFAFAAESRSTAFGATPNVGGVANVNLQAVWPSDPSGHSYRDHFWHSGEFRGTYSLQQDYWGELLGSQGFNIK